jgi:serine/threonine-protein kinase
MGSVWRAEDTLLGRAVAIKVLADDLAQDDEARRRFRREGEIAAQLDHPGICAVYEAGEQDGLTWLAMAYIDGETLSDRIRERLMPIDQVVRVGRMAADALAHAHARGVKHRDVTSRNIMIARDGRVVLLDFGLAIVSDASRITGPGAVVGTIAYMAPELLCGQNATPRSDLYGLGVVLYEMLTGARPFYSENAEALRYRVIQESPEPVQALRPEVPEALEAVVMKAMARMTKSSYQNDSQ